MLTLHTSNRLEILTARYAKLIAASPLPPLQPETVIVQSRGMETWLRLELARVHGVCANMHFPFPNAFAGQIVKTVLPGMADRPDQPERETMLWDIMRLLPGLCGEAPFARIAAYTADDADGVKLFQLSRRIADLFDQYQVFRPDMIARWDRDETSDDPDEKWQSVLWKKMMEGRPGAIHRAALYTRLLASLGSSAPASAALAPRISVFGISSLPPCHVDILCAIAAHCDVHVFAVNPSRQLWDYIEAETDIARKEAHGEQPGAHHRESGNDLLASLGMHGRDFFYLFNRQECQTEELYVEPGGSSLLSMVQADILDLRNPEQPPVVAVDDCSIRIHSCHGPIREIEVLKDTVLDLFQKDPQLNPHDILVMAPDIETYAPFIHAVFGAPSEGVPPIPFCIADRGIKANNRTVTDFLALFDCATGRFAAPSVVALLESPAIGAAYDVAPDDLPAVRQWIGDAAIRWGYDTVQKQDDGVPATAENTWRQGLDRLLLGAVMSCGDDVRCGDIIPLESTQGHDTAVLGGVARFVRDLADVSRDISTARPLRQWASVLSGVFDRMFRIGDDDGESDRTVVRAIAALEEMQEKAAFDRPVSFAVVRQHLETTLGDQQHDRHFLSGGVTFCSMLPMRSIPRKVICLLGMSDGAFPRRDFRSGFDLISRSKRRGDRSRRDDDRYLFLESLLSARTHLHISYAGRSMRDNSDVPPSVLVSELQDYCHRYYGLDSGRLLIRHPLQAFSPAYFDGTHDDLFSYSVENRDACGALTGPRRPEQPFFTGVLEPSGPDAPSDLPIDALISFFVNPAAYFVRQALGIRLFEAGEAALEDEPFSLSDLTLYEVKQTMTRQIEEGRAPADIYAGLRQAGKLPHGAVGRVQFRSVLSSVLPFAEALHHIKPASPGASFADCAVTLGGRTVFGRVRTVTPAALLRYRCALIKPKDRIRAWIYHLLMTSAGRTGLPAETILLGQVRKGAGTECRRYRAPDSPGDILAGLIELYQAGLRRPLPFFPETSCAFVEGADVSRAWESGDYHTGESADPYNALCWKETAVAQLAEFQELAHRFWKPLLDHESTGDKAVQAPVGAAPKAAAGNRTTSKRSGADAAA